MKLSASSSAPHRFFDTLRARSLWDALEPHRKDRVLLLVRQVRAHVRREQWAPSRRELARALFCSPSTIAKWVGWAEQVGALERLKRSARALRVTARGIALSAREGRLS